MTADHTIPATAVGEERSGYEDRLGHQTRSLTPRLVPVPPPPDEVRQAVTVADNQVGHMLAGGHADASVRRSGAGL
jgi:hypothetical protein